MPNHVMMCDKCGLRHEIYKKIADDFPEFCPQCKSKTCYHQDVASLATVICQAEVMSVGRQAELNMKRLGKEQVAMLQDQYDAGGPSGPPPPDFLPKEVPYVPVDKIKDLNHYVRTGETN